MAHRAERPNILFVFSDQHRWCDLGCYGNDQVVSPHLDAFAAGALRLDHCISNSPLCVPARGTLLTGLMPLRHGAAANDLPLKDGVESFAAVLRGHGYHTGYVGKWHLAGVPRDRAVPAERRCGFTEWKAANCTHNYLNSWYHDEENRRHEIEGYDAVAHTDLAVDFIERNRGEAPWCLALSWGPPHDPYHAVPREYLDPYAEQQLALRPNVGESARVTPDRHWDRAEILDNHRGYYAHITALDAQFGRLLGALDRTGQREQTVVVYTSDHGDLLGSQGMTNKQLPWDESIRVPLLVAWPGRTFRGVTEELLGLVDLPVSLLGLVGLGFSGPVDGEDLHRLFLDPAAVGRDACYIFDLSACHQATWRGTPEWRGLRTRSHTFARTVHDAGWVLYDNRADPYQLHNLVDDSAQRKLQAALSRRLDALIERHDRLAPWAELCREQGLKEAWNASQAYFSEPLLD